MAERYIQNNIQSTFVREGVGGVVRRSSADVDPRTNKMIHQIFREDLTDLSTEGLYLIRRDFSYSTKRASKTYYGFNDWIEDKDEADFTFIQEDKQVVMSHLVLPVADECQ